MYGGFGGRSNWALVLGVVGLFAATPAVSADLGGNCCSDLEERIAELEYLLNKNSKKLVILASHHTLKSYGIHGGYFPIKQFLFPLTDIDKKLMIPIPVLGIIYPIVRGVYGTPEDLRYPAYANMIAGVEKAASKYPNVIFAGGHEHTLQLIKDSSHYYIVSGAGSKSTRVSSKPKKTIYKAESFGFASLRTYPPTSQQTDHTGGVGQGRSSFTQPAGTPLPGGDRRAAASFYLVAPPARGGRDSNARIESD